jgi:biopolymer transport protein ExbD
MARRHHYRRLAGGTPNLDVTTFLNLMVALAPFLLITAVFSRITILELDLPSSASAAPAEPVFRLEVIVREEGFELTNGSARIAAIPKVDGEYDLGMLSQLVLSLKRDHPDAEDASVLLEPEIEYDHLIQVMDVLRSAEVPLAAAEGAAAAPQGAVAATAPAPTGAPQAVALAEAAQTTRVALFTDIAVGDAP